jgi:rhodanese-related sulfurtransferase
MQGHHKDSYSDGHGHMLTEIDPQEFLQRRAAGKEMTLLDVREDWEIAAAPVPAELIHIPMGELADRLGELDPGKETVVICHSGGRSMQVARFLEAKGFVSVVNLAGGIHAWSRDVDPTIPQY